eukprot:1605429-Rhodomonas_salina.1
MGSVLKACCGPFRQCSFLAPEPVSKLRGNEVAMGSGVNEDAGREHLHVFPQPDAAFPTDRSTLKCRYQCVSFVRNFDDLCPGEQVLELGYRVEAWV